jgi:acyl-CoA reductase-like NAD-dependent aldehyde dehydrogenase
MAGTSDRVSSIAGKLINHRPFADEEKIATIVSRLRAAGWNTRKRPGGAAKDLAEILHHEFATFLRDVQSVAASAAAQDETGGPNEEAKVADLPGALEALRLADATFRGAGMDMDNVERKVGIAIRDLADVIGVALLPGEDKLGKKPRS